MRRLSAMVLGVLGLLASAPAFANDTVYYYYNDAQGSPVAVTDASGNVVERTQYAPYGQVLNRPEHDGPGYTKHEEDAATGLTNMQQRYDDKALGRMLSTDPMDVDPGTGANFNRYAYAADNPYRFIDPSGMAPTQPVAASSDTCGADGACARGPDQTQQEFNKQEVHQAEAGSIEATFAGSTAFMSGASAMGSSGEFAGGNGSALGAMSVKNVGFSTSQQNPKGSSQAGKELSGWVNGLYYCQPNCIQPGPALDAESNRISNSYWPLFFVPPAAGAVVGTFPTVGPAVAPYARTVAFSACIASTLCNPEAAPHLIEYAETQKRIVNMWNATQAQISQWWQQVIKP